MAASRWLLSSHFAKFEHLKKKRNQTSVVYILFLAHLCFFIRQKLLFGACVTYGTPCRNSSHPLFSLTHVTQHHTVVIRYSTRVINRTPCYVNGHLVIYHHCNGYERASLL